MGTGYHFHVCRRTKDNKWQELLLYKKNKEGQYEPAYIDYGSHHTLYECLRESSTTFNFSPDRAEGEFKELLEDRFPKDKSFTGYLNLEYANLADLKLYLYSNPTIENEYGEELPDGSLPLIKNPVSTLVEDAEKIINFTEDSWEQAGLSDYCIVFYCDI